MSFAILHFTAYDDSISQVSTGNNADKSLALEELQANENTMTNDFSATSADVTEENIFQNDAEINDLNCSSVLDTIIEVMSQEEQQDRDCYDDSDEDDDDMNNSCSLFNEESTEGTPL